MIHGGRRRQEDEVQVAGKKRTSPNEIILSDDEDIRETKRFKKRQATAPPLMRLTLSGYKRWVGNAKKEAEERVSRAVEEHRQVITDSGQARLRELGILITLDAFSCSHLASPSIVRTQKFVCALAHAPVILSTAFVDDCLEKDELLDASDYLLNDKEGEKRVGFKLAQSLERAKANKGQLLQGYTVYCTENVHGGFDTYKAIVEVNGGKCLLYRARSTTHVGRQNSGADREGRTPEHVYLISGTSADDAKMWPKFRQMVQDSGKIPRIVRNDWMLSLALSQEIRWKEHYELSEKDVVPAAV